MRESPDDDLSESTPRLLRAWSRSRSDEAFRELVRRHVDMVHSVAERRLGAHRDAAADVTQAVFVRLARKADALPESVVLGAWLHRQTVRLALNFLRAENRRQLRETAAAPETMTTESEVSWKELAPELDEALAALDAADRDILYLRYFDDRRTSDIAAALDVSREAAQKRMERALENLRSRLRRRMALPAGAGLGALLSGNTVRAAPASLAARAGAAALTDFHQAAWWLRLGRGVAARPWTALAGAAAGLALGWTHADSVFPASSPGGAGGMVEDLAKTDRAARPEKAAVDKPESILAALERLAREPATFRVTVAFDALMLRAEARDLISLMRAAAAGLPEPVRGRVLGMLLKRQTEKDPAAAMEFLAAHRAADWVTDRFRMTFGTWALAAPEAATRWLSAWIAAGGQLGEEGTDRADSLANMGVCYLTRSDPERGVSFVRSLPPRLRQACLGGLADDAYSSRWRTDWLSEQWLRLAESAAAAIDAGELPREALPRILDRWTRDRPDDAAAWRIGLPEGGLARFSAELRSRGNDLFSQIGGGGRETKEAYAARIRQAIHERGDLPLGEALTEVASRWSDGLPELVKLLQEEKFDGEGDVALALAIRRMKAKWPPVQVRNSTTTPLPVATLHACESISDAAIREPLIVGLFRRWHAEDQAAAAAWLPQSGWKAERIAAVKQRISLP